MNARILKYPIAAVAVALGIHAAAAATVVNVQLMDMALDKGLASGLSFNTPGVHSANATAMIMLSRATAPAGNVTFNVQNVSKDLTHEMLVVQLTDPSKPLPYLSEELTVDEDQVKSLGEVPEIDPGKTGTLTVNLKPGTYLLFCNVPGHFDAGMWTTFTVT